MNSFCKPLNLGKSCQTLAPVPDADQTVECPACRNPIKETACRTCNGRGYVTERQFNDYEPLS